MIRALWTAASGMSAQQLNVDTIANNLANVNTTGFKRQRVDYQDLFYQTLREPGTEEGTPNGLEVGMGTYPVATQKIFAEATSNGPTRPWTWPLRERDFSKLGCPTEPSATRVPARSGWTRTADWLPPTDTPFSPKSPSLPIPKK
jgi:hypothetical protein